ncbi:MAG: hypothetical protein ABR596_08520 [Halarsenatibacteraceae bacterium]
MDMESKQSMLRDMPGLKKYMLIILLLVIAVIGYRAFYSTSKDPAVKLFQTDSGSYYLYLSEDVNHEEETSIMIHPFFGQANNQEDLQSEAKTQITRMQAIADEVNSPLLVPVFSVDDYQDPEKAELLAEFFHDARRELEEINYQIADKANLFGFGVSGHYASYWLNQHPELVNKAAIGSPGGWPAEPQESEYNNDIAILFFQGAEDDFSLLDQKPYFTENEQAELQDRLPEDPLERFQLAVETYQEAGFQVETKFYPELDHRITMEVNQDIAAFIYK